MPISRGRIVDLAALLDVLAALLNLNLALSSILIGHFGRELGQLHLQVLVLLLERFYGCCQLLLAGCARCVRTISRIFSCGN